MANVIWQLQARDVFPLGCHDPRNHVSLPSKTGPRGTLAPWPSGGAGRAGDLPFSRGALRSSGFGLPTSGPAPPGHAGRRKSRAPGPATCQAPTMDPRVAANRALWNEWTPIHVRSAFYDVEGWKSGGGSTCTPAGLRGRRRRRQGPAPPAVPLRAGHPRLGQAGGQGHRGRHLGAGHRAGPRPGRRDRPGRPLRGLRRGRPPGQPGGRLRRGVHLLRGPQLAARPSPLGRGGRPLRAPGGFFYIAEAHPFAWTFDDDDTATELRLRYHYWPSPDPLVFPNEGSYADPDAPVEEPFEYAWQHSMGEIITSLARPGCASSTSTSTPGSPGRCSPSWSRPSPPPASGGCRSPTTRGCPCCTRSRPPGTSLGA